jgi:type II secretory pathway pseudopilin PulG
MKITSKKKKLGVTIVELMVVVGIASVLLAVVAIFMATVFDVSRQEIEHGRINEMGRIQMEKMSDAIRTASNVDINTSGGYDGGVERWIQAADDNDITIYTDIDGNGSSELITYSLSGSNLQLGGETIAVGVQNAVQPIPTPMFKYYSVGGANAILVDPSVVGLDAIGQVQITLVIDVDTGQEPEARVYSTSVTPRRGYLASP